MSDALSFAEIDGQHMELLPARTVMSTFTMGGGDGGTSSGGNGQGGVNAPILSGRAILGTVNYVGGSGIGGASGAAGGNG